jgi:hypothetical protein
MKYADDYKTTVGNLEKIIGQDLYHHQDKMPNNFLSTIPDYKQAYRAIQMFKDEYLLDYINVSTPHVYWLARGFVLLSDVYSKMGRKLDARQYLLSLKQNYQAEDDIAGMIESRLEALKE